MLKEELRIVFMGTPPFAAATLRRLVDGGYNVVAVVTQPDRPAGRHGRLHASAVKQYALRQGLPVLQPERLRDEDFLSELKTYNADLQVVVAFRMLPEAVWAMPPLGTFNVHASLLPQYRGAAPINWAVINGERRTGVTTFFLDRTIDTGRIIMQRPFEIPDSADAGYVCDGLMAMSADIAVDTVNKIIAGNGVVETRPQPQADNLRPAPKINNDTCRVNWAQTRERVYDFVRGLSPLPGAWTTLAEASSHDTLKIFATVITTRSANGRLPGAMVVERGHLYGVCSDGLLEITQVQPAGRRRMSARDFINGMRTR